MKEKPSGLLRDLQQHQALVCTGQSSAPSSPDGGGRELAPVPFLSERLWGIACCVTSVLTRLDFYVFQLQPEMITHTHLPI